MPLTERCCKRASSCGFSGAWTSSGCGSRRPLEDHEVLVEVTRLGHVGNGVEQVLPQGAHGEPVLREERAPVRLGLRVHVHETALAGLRCREYDYVAQTGQALHEARCAPRRQVLCDLDAECEVEVAEIRHAPFQVRSDDSFAELRTLDCRSTSLDPPDVDSPLGELRQHETATGADVHHGAGRAQANQGFGESRVRIELHRIALGVETLVVDEVASREKGKPSKHLAQRVPDRTIDAIEPYPHRPADLEGYQASKQAASPRHGREAYGRG